MDKHDVKRELTDLLDEGERLVEDERRALRTLDIAAIESAAERKASLDARFGALNLTEAKIDAIERARLVTLRDGLRHNQLLLVHARASTQSAIALVSGAAASSYPNAPGAAHPAPVRVDVRG